jgi:hypothetical protein
MFAPQFRLKGDVYKIVIGIEHYVAVTVSDYVPSQSVASIEYVTLSDYLK